MEAIDVPMSDESAVTSVEAVAVEKEREKEASIVDGGASAVNDEASIVNDESSNVNREADESFAPTVKKSDVIDQNCNGDSVSVENELNDAMASATISTTDTDAVKENPVEEVVGEKLKEEIAIVKEEVADVVDNPDVSVKTLQQGQDKEIIFEDALEFVDDEDNCVEELEKSDVIREENATAGENCNDEQLKEGELDVVEEGKKDVSEGKKDVAEEGGEPSEAEPKVPVPVDDDTNDPQYIPRRGRFYEHDDRMAYSTTSSEGSDSSNEYEDSEEYDEENSDCRERRRRRTTGSKMRKAKSEKNVVENMEQLAIDNTTTPSTKKVLAISKVAAVTKNSVEMPVNPAFESSKKLGSKKSRDIDSLDKWTHDMYNENEQTPKSKDELLASYGYDIREESEAPRARRHHKYGRAATAKYTRSWQDTKAYSGAGGGPQSPKVKQRGGIGRRSISGPNKIKNNSATSTEYSSEFPALDGKKPSGTSSAAESPAITAASNELHQEKKTNNKATTTGLSQQHTTSSQTSKYATSPNPNHQQGQSNGEPGSLSHNKNSFKRPTDSSADKDKSAHANRDSPASKDKSALANRDSTGLTTNNSLFNRRPQQQHSGGHNYKLQNYNINHGGQGHNQYRQQSPPSALRGRNFHQNHNSQFNRDRYFAKGAIPPSSNHQNYDAPITAGTGRTQHSGGHYHNYNHRRYENDSEQIEQPLPPPPPVVRSSKRYSVQSRRELPDPVLNFGGMNKPPSQQQPTVPQHQQQNGLVMQEQQSTMQQIQTQQMQTQQQPPIQMHQQQPPPIQLQQYHQPLQQIHPHHGMVLDHNTGMMVMAAADPTLYHHQLYAAPQYATAMPPGSGAGSTDDQNAVAAAAALQMLAAQAAVYQPVPTGATGVTSPPSGAQPETFMTTYYQPQQQPQQQPPPRRVNLAIPIVAPPPEPMQQQNAPKTNPSPTPTPAAT